MSFLIGPDFKSRKTLVFVIVILTLVRIVNLNVGWNNHFFGKDDVAPHAHTISLLLDGYAEWDDEWLAGYNRFTYYPNLFYMTASVLSNLLGFWQGFKSMYVATQIFLPVTFYFLLRKVGVKERFSLLGVIAFLLVEQSTFFLANSVRIFSYNFVFLSLGFTLKYLKKSSKKNAVTLSLILSLSVLSHTTIGIITFLLTSSLFLFNFLETRQPLKNSFLIILSLILLTSYFLFPLLWEALPTLISRMDKNQVINRPTPMINCDKTNFFKNMFDLTSREFLGEKFLRIRAQNLFFLFIGFNIFLFITVTLFCFIYREKNLFFKFILLINSFMFLIFFFQNFLPLSFRNMIFIGTTFTKYLMIIPLLLLVDEDEKEKVSNFLLFLVVLFWSSSLFFGFITQGAPVNEYITFSYEAATILKPGPREPPQELSKITDYLHSKNFRRITVYPFKGFFSRVKNIYAGNLFSAYEEYFFPAHGIELIGATVPYADPKYEDYTLKTLYPYSCLEEVKCIPSRGEWTLINTKVPPGLGADDCFYLSGRELHELMVEGGVQAFGVNAVFDEFVQYFKAYPEFFELDKVVEINSELVPKQYYFFNVKNSTGLLKCDENVSYELTKNNGEVLIQFNELPTKCDLSVSYSPRWFPTNAEISADDYGFIRLKPKDKEVRLNYTPYTSVNFISFATFILLSLYPLWSRKNEDK